MLNMLLTCAILVIIVPMITQSNTHNTDLLEKICKHMCSMNWLTANPFRDLIQNG